MHSKLYPVKQTTISLVVFSTLYPMKQNANVNHEDLEEDVMGLRLEVRSDIDLGRVELIIEAPGSKKTLPQPKITQQLHTSIEI